MTGRGPRAASRGGKAGNAAGGYADPPLQPSRRVSHHAARGPRPAALLIVLLIFLVSLVPAAAERPNGAGLVVRHGDGTLLYVYVQFEEETISGIELLYRSGLELTVAPFGGLGEAVCRLNGE